MFVQFMMENYLKDQSPIGDLARDIKCDATFPENADTEEAIQNYLEAEGACWQCIDAFLQAWEAYTC
ncbi:sterile alpha motif-like domain-containing protein [Savagea faecisuis]|uniref:Sterile alpha motif-like domain-containing protein n=1 Tax=Savagea faecisuis TaxID=1274803 RepID=A0ABW3GUT6_9BACL